MAAPTPPRCPIGGSDHAPRTTIAPPRERFPCTAPPVPMARPFPHHSASVVLRTVVSSSTVCMEIPDRFHSPLVTGCSATRRCGSFVARLLLRSIQPLAPAVAPITTFVRCATPTSDSQLRRGCAPLLSRSCRSFLPSGSVEPLFPSCPPPQPMELPPHPASNDLMRPPCDPLPPPWCLSPPSPALQLAQ